MLGGTKVTVTGTGFPMEADSIKVITKRITMKLVCIVTILATSKGLEKYSQHLMFFFAFHQYHVYL